MAIDPLYIGVGPTELFGDYEQILCWNHYRDYYDQIGNEFFKNHFLNSCRKHNEVIEIALADGVIDQTDFDFFRLCKQDDDCSGVDDQYKFLRRLYVSTKRFSRSDEYKDFLSVDELGKYRRWFEEEGYNMLIGSGSNNGEVFDNLLLCKGGLNCYLNVFNKRFLLVVHPTSGYDGSSAKIGVDREVEIAKVSGEKAVYLIQETDYFDWLYPEDISPGYIYASKGGEHNIIFSGKEVILVGGYFDNCFTIALDHLISRFIGDELTIRIPTDSVYILHGTLEKYINWLGKGAREYLLTHNFFKLQDSCEKCFQGIEVEYKGELLYKSKDILGKLRLKVIFE